MRRLIAFLMLAALVAGGCSLEDVIGSSEVPSPSVTLSQSDERPPASNTADIVERVLPSVVNVRVESFVGAEQAAGEGSGVVIDENGIILTNAHVVENSFEVRVLFNDGRDPLAGRVLGIGPPGQDLAVVKVDADDLEPIEIGKSSNLRLGDKVIALGFPLGFGGPSVTEGILSGEGRTIKPQPAPGEPPIRLENLLQTDAAINPGNSGGALVDGNGRLVGINTAAAGAGTAENIGFAIPIDDALPVIEEILSKPAEERAWLGVLLAPVDSSAVAAQLGLDPDVRGVVITEIVPGGPADDAGLEPGGVITAVDDVEIEQFGDLTAALVERSPGEIVILEIVTEEGTENVEVELGLRPQSFATPTPED